MLHQAITYIQKEVEATTNLDVVLDHPHSDFSAVTAPEILLSLVNINEEATLKNQPHQQWRNGRLLVRHPPVFLNIYLLFIGRGTDYKSCLETVSRVIQCFQSKPAFQQATTSGVNTEQFPPNIEKLVFELYPLTLEQVNHLWGVNGSKYYPSVLYKVRLVQEEKSDQEQEGPEIREVTVNSDVL